MVPVVIPEEFTTAVQVPLSSAPVYIPDQVPWYWLIVFDELSFEQEKDNRATNKVNANLKILFFMILFLWVNLIKRKN